MLPDYDATLRGVVPWEPTGAEDTVEWEARYGVGGADGPHPAALLTRVIRPPFDPNVYGGPKVAGGGSGDGGFWAALTAKSGTTCKAYTFVEVEEDGEPTAWAAVSGGRTGTAYEVNCVDLPVAAVADGPVVVRVYTDESGDFYFESAPRWEFVRPTGAISGGYYPGVLTTFGAGGTPADGETILILDLNTL
jgi:hypothetical protein